MDLERVGEELGTEVEGVRNRLSFLAHNPTPGYVALEEQEKAGALRRDDESLGGEMPARQSHARVLPRTAGCTRVRSLARTLPRQLLQSYRHPPYRFARPVEQTLCRRPSMPSS